MNSKNNYLLHVQPDNAVKIPQLIVPKYSIEENFKRFNFFLLFFLKVARNLQVYI
jgi:hypothetical protein